MDVPTAEALRRSSLLDVPTSDLPDGVSPPQYIADKGYVGSEIIASKRIPALIRSVLTTRSTKRPSEHVRYKIERVIANIKTWRVLHTGHRRPLDTFPETITAILGIIFTYTL